jgi:membrane protein DedA with SNARE-associated domain
MTDLLISLSIFDGLDANTFVHWFFENASYIFVFVFMAVESSFIPFPSEVVVPPAVYVGLTTGNMDVVLITVIATVGAVVGATINYWLSVWLGRPIVYRFANSRFGHMCLIDQTKVENAERYFDQHGAFSTFVGRLIPAVRQLISIPAGLARIHFGKFAIFTGLGALVWNIILATIGYSLTFAFPNKDDFFDAVEKYNGYLTIGGLILLLLVVAYLIYKGLHNKRQPSK